MRTAPMPAGQPLCRVGVALAGVDVVILRMNEPPGTGGFGCVARADSNRRYRLERALQPSVGDRWYARIPLFQGTFDRRRCWLPWATCGRAVAPLLPNRDRKAGPAGAGNTEP